MYSSGPAAEKAAIEGQGQEFDTQQCRDLQAEILSSSVGRLNSSRARFYRKGTTTDQ